MRKYIKKTARSEIFILRVLFECLVFPQVNKINLAIFAFKKKSFFECTPGYLLAHLSGTERK